MSADWLEDREPQFLTSAPEGIGVGYHTASIPKGVFGESSKIMEEVLELQDAEKQGAKIMGLHELSDIIGAVRGYLSRHHPGTSFEDVVKMADITERAFKTGHRK